MARSISATRILHDWWQSKRGDRAMPARAELDPAELKSILANLILIDVRAASEGHGAEGREAGGRQAGGPGLTFTYRLAGTEIDDRFGVSLTGRTLDEIPLGDARAMIRKQYEAAVAEARPVFCSHNVTVGGERYVEYERLLVPLSGDVPGQVTALAAAVDFRCAYLILQGRPPLCSAQTYCDRIDLCLARSPNG